MEAPPVNGTDIAAPTMYIVDGGAPLHGTVPISGAKNAVLKLMSAAVLCEEPCTITNAPRIADVEYILEVLCDLGADAGWVGDHELRIHARHLDWEFIPLEAAKRLRASFVLLGPMLGRRRKVVIPNPGGDRIGRRPVNVHVDALRALGAEIVYKWGYYFAQAPGGLHGTDLRLPEASVTGTENVLMAAVLAEGRTTISNAAAEPEVDNLIEFLNAIGGNVRRDQRNAHTIVIDGVPRDALHGAAVEVIPDRIEAGSFTIAAAITGGEVLLAGARADHLGAFLDACRATGIEIEVSANGFSVAGRPPFRRHEITTQIYPGFPTDLQAPFSLVLVNADGVSTINELLYEDRFDYTQALQQMGAKIHVFSQHTAVFWGPSRLQGTHVEIPDLRAGATLVLAALAAEGESRIAGIEHVTRGYENMAGKLNAVGARINEVCGGNT